MFDGSMRQASYFGGISRLRGILRLPVKLPRARKTQRLPGNAWLRRDVGLPREPDAQPHPYLYR